MTHKIKNSFRANNPLLRCFTASLSALISGTGFCEPITLLHLTQQQTHESFSNVSPSRPNSTSLPNHNTKCLVRRCLVSSQVHMKRVAGFQSGLRSDKLIPKRQRTARLYENRHQIPNGFSSLLFQVAEHASRSGYRLLQR
jgi:hypothetical protein